MNKSKLAFRGVAFVALLLVGVFPSSVEAGMFHWGDFDGDDVMYLDVTEDNSEGTSLFAPMPGSGGPSIAGNQLHLDPQGFASQSSSNSAHALDSTLTTTIMAKANSVIDTIQVAEHGDFSLGGLDGGQANAQVGAAFFWTVLEVDNAAVSLETQATNLILSSGSGPNGGKYSRPGDDGTTTVWKGAANIDVAGFLASENIVGNATKVRLRFDNALQTAADTVSTAFIKKKGIDISVTPRVPEPTTILLLGMAGCFVGLQRRRD